MGLHGAVAQPTATPPAPPTAPPEAPAPPPSMNAQRIYDATKSRLVQVRTLLKDQDSQSTVGSGFVVDGQGLAITNYHVVSQFALKPERYRLSFSLPGGRTGAVQLLAIDVIHDLALLRLVSDDKSPAKSTDTAQWPTLTFRPAAQPLSQGDRLYALGNPLDVGFAVMEGLYNGLVARSHLPQIFFGGSLNPGMSGGPAVDDAGRIIGVNVAARRDGEQVSFLVPAPYAQALLERGRAAQPITQAVHAEVTAQLMEHQAALAQRFMAMSWRSANHLRYRVPVPQEDFMRCWGSTQMVGDSRYLDFQRSDCVMDHAIFVSGSLLTGTISVRHEAYDGTKLGALRFARMYSKSFANEGFHSGRSATPPECKERFVNRDGLAMRTVVCLSALKRFKGLYNLSVLTTTVDHATQGVQGRLDARGLAFASALKLAEHYLQGFALVTSGKAPAAARAVP
jgi:S1-C subfamily serine protease